jgi:uncharacterized protein (DUF2252 family)
MPEHAARDLAQKTVAAYRGSMAKLMQLDPQRAWCSRVNITRAIAGIGDPKQRRRQAKRLHTAALEHRKGYRKLLEQHKSGWRIRPQLPLVPPSLARRDDTLELVARTAFEAYKVSQPEERGVLLDRYRLADVAFKVVGIGSVGTFCALGLFADRDGATLLLQLKEAQQSVLAPYAAPSIYENQGQRVVTGQRIMQSEHDMFLGWTREHGSDQYCYVRSLKDSRLSSVGEELIDQALSLHAHLCGTALARAHARSGDAARIAGYMGAGASFDASIAAFALSYAGQVESDWRLFVEAIRSGMLQARDL